MCGIAGIVDVRGRAVDRAALGRMIDVQRHRGPDDDGIYLGEGVGLAHTRLAIIDVSPNGRQPISNEDGSLHLVCNGEIYNFRELREQLEHRGHRFATATDVEVIVHLYEEAGDDCVQALRGMFAFALWDSRRHRLLLARDRIGQKPLVYGMQEGRLVFASEVKAILSSHAIDATLDPDAVNLIFTYGFTPWPHTMFREIRRLPPASLVVLEGERPRAREYWKPRLVPKRTIRPDEAADTLLALLREATRLQSVSDVPTGVLLSGGLDSSTVASLVAEQGGRPLRTFTVGFAGQDDPDMSSARAVARTLGAQHEEIPVDARMIDSLPRALWHYDEPYTNPLILPHFELCRRMKRSVTVVHGAEGADELLGGYRGYSHWKWFERLHRAAATVGVGRVAGRIAGRLPATSSLRKPALLLSAAPESLRGVKRDLDAGPARQLYSDELIAELSPDLPRRLLQDSYVSAGPGPFLDRILMMDLLRHNAHGVTTFSDVLGMAHAVEVRSIFLDHRVVEFVASLPVPLKLPQFGGRKYVLRRAVRDLVPPHVLHRRKAGYGEWMPFARLFSGEWSGFARDVLLGGTLGKSGLFNQPAIEALWMEHARGTRNHFGLAWALLCFGVWYEMHRASSG